MWFGSFPLAGSACVDGEKVDGGVCVRACFSVINSLSVCGGGVAIHHGGTDGHPGYEVQGIIEAGTILRPRRSVNSVRGTRHTHTRFYFLIPSPSITARILPFPPTAILRTVRHHKSSESRGVRSQLSQRENPTRHTFHNNRITTWPEK